MMSGMMRAGMLALTCSMSQAWSQVTHVRSEPVCPPALDTIRVVSRPFASPSIEGVVTNRDTRAPVSFAQVQLVPGNHITTADSLGRFQFGSLAIDAERADYVIKVRRMGYERDSVLVYLAPRTAVTVRLPIVPAYVDRCMEIRSYYDVKGVVRGPGGAALDSVLVELTYDGRRALRRTRTSKNGVFELADVPHGFYQVLTRRMGYGATTLPLTVGPGRADSTIVITMPIGRISRTRPRRSMRKAGRSNGVSP